MRKFFSKIVVTLILATVLWSGVGFDIEKVFAYSDCTALKDAANADRSDTVKRDAAMACFKENGEQASIAGGDSILTGLNPRESAAVYEKCSFLGIYSVSCVNREKAAVLATKTPEQIALDSKTFVETHWYDFVKGTFQYLAEGALKTVLMVVGGFLQIVWIPLLGLLLRIVGACLDLSIQFTLNSKNISGVSEAIKLTWGIIRNFCNIAFIFVLLYSAIKMIVGVANANAKKMVANVIMAAILINFSLFITQVVIDVGNILATALYNAALGTQSVSDKIMDIFGFGALFALPANVTIWSVDFFLISIIQVITMTIAIITFIYVMMMMVVRSIVLIFLMVLSPIGFMGRVLPKIEEYTKMWYDNLYGQVVIAPFFLLFFYLIVQLAEGLNVTDLALDSKNQAFTQYFKYVLMTTLLIVAVKVTKKMSGVVGDLVERAGTFAGGAALGALSGGAAFAMRHTAGRGANRYLESEAGKDLRTRADAGDRGAKLKLAALEKTSKATFDVRNTKTAGMAMGELNKLTGLKTNLGKGSGSYSKDGKQTGYAGQRKVEQEAENKRYNEIKKSEANDTEGQIAAAGVIHRRETVATTALSTNANHLAAKSRKEALLDVSGDASMQAAEAAVRQAETDVRNASAANADAAKADLEKAKVARDAVKDPLVVAKKAQHAKEIAEQEKIMRDEKQKELAAVRLSDQEKKALARVERSKNYANSVRHGRGALGSLRSHTESGELADRMESSTPTSAEEENRELLKEIRETQRKLEQQNKP